MKITEHMKARSKIMQNALDRAKQMSIIKNSSSGDDIHGSDQENMVENFNEMIDVRLGIKESDDELTTLFSTMNGMMRFFSKYRYFENKQIKRWFKDYTETQTMLMNNYMNNEIQGMPYYPSTEKGVLIWANKCFRCSIFFDFMGDHYAKIHLDQNLEGIFYKLKYLQVAAPHVFKHILPTEYDIVFEDDFSLKIRRIRYLMNFTMTEFARYLVAPDHPDGCLKSPEHYLQMCGEYIPLHDLQTEINYLCESIYGYIAFMIRIGVDVPIDKFNIDENDPDYAMMYQHAQEMEERKQNVSELMRQQRAYQKKNEVITVGNDVLKLGRDGIFFNDIEVVSKDDIQAEVIRQCRISRYAVRDDAHVNEEVLENTDFLLSKQDNLEMSYNGDYPVLSYNFIKNRTLLMLDGIENENITVADLTGQTQEQVDEEMEHRRDTGFGVVRQYNDAYLPGCAIFTRNGCNEFFTPYYSYPPNHQSSGQFSLLREMVFQEICSDLSKAIKQEEERAIHGVTETAAFKDMDKMMEGDEKLYSSSADDINAENVNVYVETPYKTEEQKKMMNELEQKRKVFSKDCKPMPMNLNHALNVIMKIIPKEEIENLEEPMQKNTLISKYLFSYIRPGHFKGMIDVERKILERKGVEVTDAAVMEAFHATSARAQDLYMMTYYNGEPGTNDDGDDLRKEFLLSVEDEFSEDDMYKQQISMLQKFKVTVITGYQEGINSLDPDEMNAMSMYKRKYVLHQLIRDTVLFEAARLSGEGITPEEKLAYFLKEKKAIEQLEKQQEEAEMHAYEQDEPQNMKIEQGDVIIEEVTTKATTGKKKVTRGRKKKGDNSSVKSGKKMPAKRGRKKKVVKDEDLV